MNKILTEIPQVTKYIKFFRSSCTATRSVAKTSVTFSRWLALFSILILLSLLFNPYILRAEASETYVLDRMWPEIDQSMYFQFPQGIAADASGNVYIVDTWNHCIQKFTSSGAFLAKWGRVVTIIVFRGDD